jgi:Raf kinase inhibitor-like YbhB/YbcL family protein
MSPAFKNNDSIPEKYSAFGENINPPLEISDIPQDAQSLVLVMDDPDVPAGSGVDVWDHWIVFNIPPNVTSIPEDWQPVGVLGQATDGTVGYTGPRPPDKEHRYFIQVYALDTMLALPPASTKDEILQAMGDNVLAQAQLVGWFEPISE